jgi:hypothetical protein
MYHAVVDARPAPVPLAGSSPLVLESKNGLSGETRPSMVVLGRPEAAHTVFHDAARVVWPAAQRSGHQRVLDVRRLTPRLGHTLEADTCRDVAFDEPSHRSGRSERATLPQGRLHRLSVAGWMLFLMGTTECVQRLPRDG